ncbi:MAG: prolyl oligopeptidase family serine peptidase, partial [Alphaproteobacteria bacterium]|nr:prolyl oligopeptidase family serine peptidase [Alphaproteobacteria bacterium]
SDEDRAGLDAACPHVKEYVNRMIAEYGCDKVCLVGFSQGALVAFEMMYLMKISKVISYCGEFIVPQGKEPVSKPECLLVHSDDDPVVRYPEAVRARKDLMKLGVPVELVTHHNVGHGVSAEGWKIGAAFLSGARKLTKPCLLRRLFCRGV